VGPRCLIAAAALAALAGCGDGLKRVPVEGTLTAKGRPLGGALVQFVPAGATKGEGGIGRADADGRFTLTGSRAGDPGVVPGEYTVRVSRFVAADGTPLPADARDADYPGSRESIPAPYSSPDGTPLRVTVPETGGAITVDLPVPIPGRK
jgi:hypothetical protein